LLISLEQLSIASVGTADLWSNDLDPGTLLLDRDTQGFDQATIGTVTDEHTDHSAFQGLRGLADYAERRRGFDVAPLRHGCYRELDRASEPQSSGDALCHAFIDLHQMRHDALTHRRRLDLAQLENQRRDDVVLFGLGLT